MYFILGLHYIFYKPLSKSLVQLLEKQQETLSVVTIAIICSTLASNGNCNIFGGIYITQSNIYDGAFIAKIVSRSVYPQKGSIRDLCLGSKYTFAFRKNLQRFYFFKVLYIF